MPYTITSDKLGLAIDLVVETATDVHEALSKARQMYETYQLKTKRGTKSTATSYWPA
jgi:hypothetical protein